MWTLIPTGQFKKDLKRYRNRLEKLASLKSVLDLLQENGEVPHEYDPHMLKSDYKGFMEYHSEETQVKWSTMEAESQETFIFQSIQMGRACIRFQNWRLGRPRNKGHLSLDIEN